MARIPGTGRRVSIAGLSALALLQTRQPAEALNGPGQVDDDQPQIVQAAMRRVHFRLDPSVVLHIDYLRGRLLPGMSGRTPRFDDRQSFVLAIDSAQVALDADDLSHLINRYLRSDPASPVSRYQLTIEKHRLVQRGRIHGIPFALVCQVEATPAGEVRLRPVSIRALGLPVKRLLGTLGLSLERLVRAPQGAALRFEGNDLVLSPGALLPPPAIRGRLAAVYLSQSGLIQVFRSGSVSGGSVEPPLPPELNYMYYRGGTIRFANLTMTPSDLLILDHDPDDPFDFSLDRYLDQLVAGYSRNTPWGGLVAVMPDFDEMPDPGRTRKHHPGAAPGVWASR